jgi:Fic family protein
MRTFDYSKLADYTWDTETVNLLSKIHECKGRQDLFIRQKPVEIDRLVEIAKIQSTEASNRIEGIVTTATRLNQLVKDKTKPKNRDEKEILGYRDVLNTIHESHDYIPLKPSYILQLHRDLLKHAGFSYGGKFKDTQNYIQETHADGSTSVRFTPLPPYETEAAINAICRSYEQTLSLEKVDSLILIPAFIVDFLCIHPFNDGNGRMSRLLTLLLLYQNGYQVGKYISIEKQIEKTKDIYYDTLQISDSGWDTGNNNYSAFIKYMLQMILACYIDFEERVGLMNPTGMKNTAYDVVKKYASGKVGRFTSSEVISSCPSAGRSSVIASLKKLTAEGYIRKEGSGKNTFYYRERI